MEYDLDFETLFICDNKSLKTVNDIKSLGSSITSMEMCLILEDYLKNLNLSNEKVKKLSYNINRDSSVITFKIHILSIKRITKNDLLDIRDKFLGIINTWFSSNKIHTFVVNKEKKEVFLKVK